MCLLGKIAVAGSTDSFCHYTQPDVSKPVSLSSKPTYPHGGNRGAQHTAAAILFLCLGPGLLPIYEFWGPPHPVSSHFLILGPGALPMRGLNLTHYYSPAQIFGAQNTNSVLAAALGYLVIAVRTKRDDRAATAACRIDTPPETSLKCKLERIIKRRVVEDKR